MCDLSRDVDFFLDVLHECAKKIPENYWSLNRYNPEGTPVVLRERVYCYELYHQLRVYLDRVCKDGEQAFPYTLHGEIDKRGHNYVFKQLRMRPNPDFVIHEPGTIDRNLAVIEVKSTDNKRALFFEDIDKLYAFVTKLDYRVGILYVFGPQDELAFNPDALILYATKGRTFPFIILWHQAVDTKPIMVFPNKKNERFS